MGNHSSARMILIGALTVGVAGGCGIGSSDEQVALEAQQQAVSQGGSREAGSLVIPMDLTWQDRGMLRAYGLVYRLLSNNIPVSWSVSPSKAQNGVDFAARVRDLETGAALGEVSYRGGPFVISAEHRDAALPIVQAWLASDCETVVHEALAPFYAEDTLQLASAPRMAVARDRYQAIAFANFNAAGIPDSTGARWSPSSPDLLDEAALIGSTASAADGALFDADGSPAYCHLTFTYYWQDAQTVDVVRELRSWLGASPLTHVFAQAESARAIENSSAGRFLTTRGLMDDGATPFLVRSLSPGSPIAQYHGWLLGSADVLDSIGLAPGSMFRAGTQRLLGNASSSSADQRLVLLSGPMDGDADNGNVTYLAGFDYGIDVPVSRNPWTNGVRLLLNSVLAAQCNLQAYQPQVRLLQDRPVAVAGNRLTFAVEYRNDGPASTGPTTLEVTLPAGATFVSASDGAAQQGDRVAWRFAALRVGSGGQVSFTVEVAGPGQYVSAAKLRYHVGMTTKELSNSQMLDYGEPRPPDTFFLGVPSEITDQTDATFALGTSKGGVSFQCSLDDAPFRDCEAAFTLTGLALGEHTLRARAIGVDGTSDPTPALFAWRINGVPLARPDALVVAEDAAEGVIDVLANDDRGDAPTTIIDVTAPLHGVVVQRDEQLVYTPNPNFHGDDAFMYTLRDADGETSTTEVAVMVLSVDDVPVANADTAEVAEDGQLALAVLDNDTGLGDAPVTILEASVPFHGSLVIDGTTLRYTPAADYEGPELFTYTIADRDGQTATSVVTVTVTSVSDPVVAVADAATTEEDSGGVTIDVLANDRVADAPASISALGAPSHGVVELVAGGVRYLPAAEFFGEDSFSYTVQDGDGDLATATVVVTVVSVDDVPVAAADAATVAEDGAVDIAVLPNDTGLGHAPVTVSALTPPLRGTATISGDQVRYTPAPDANGEDTFSYTISDGDGQQAVAEVQVTITAVDDVPVANADEATVAEDSGGGALAVLANDQVSDGPATVTIAVEPLHGSAAVMGGLIVYAPAPDYYGSDVLSYTITDGDGQQATAQVAIQVSAVNDTPVAVADRAAIFGNEVATLQVLVNDTNLGDAPVTLLEVSTPASGTASLDGNSVRYVPSRYFTGTVAFAYTLVDGDGERASATIEIEVTSVNLTPMVSDDDATVIEDTPAVLAVRSNDSGGDAPVTLVAVSAPGHGTAVIVGDDIRYSPAADYFGPDSFTYTVRDEDGETATATVTITVTPVNDTPAAVLDNFTIVEDSGPVLLPVLANDTGLGDAPITIFGLNTPTNGTVRVVGNQIEYTPRANYSGSEALSYRIRDADNQQSTGTVFINVTPVNDPPTANDDVFSVTAGIEATLNPLFNDRDVDGNPLTLQSVGTPTIGTVLIVANRAVYLAPLGFLGQASFTYVVSDGRGGTASATVTLNVSL